jgi:rubrerythrin
VSIIDKELYLTAGQREALTNELASKKDAIQHPLYSFNPQSYYLPYESVSQIITASAGKNFLEPSQKKRLQDLNSNDPNSQHIIFRSEAGAEEWYKQMNEAGRQQRDKYLRAIAVRVSYYQKELELSSGQIEHLTVAGKGAAVRALGDWKESTENTIEQMQQQMAQMQGNFAFGSQNMDTNAIDQNEIWADAIESIMPGAAVARCEERKNANRAAIAATLTALLDSELWLTPDQRQPLQKLVENSLPARSDPTQNQEYIREIILLAYPLFRTSAEDRDKLLTEPQRDVWKKMESFFQWQKENNYLQIPLRNQGGSFGFTLSN